MTRREQILEFLKQEPNDAFLNYALAMEQVAAGEKSEALHTLKNITVTHPNYGPTYYHLGKLYIEQGQKALAEEIFKQGIHVTRANKEQHLLAELQSALNELLFEDYE